MWLSLVERYVRDVEAAGSNPVTPIVKGLHSRSFLQYSQKRMPLWKIAQLLYYNTATLSLTRIFRVKRCAVLPRAKDAALHKEAL